MIERVRGFGASGRVEQSKDLWFAVAIRGGLIVVAWSLGRRF